MWLMPFLHAAFCFGHGAFVKVTCSVFISPCGVSLSVMEHFRSAAVAPEV